MFQCLVPTGPDAGIYPCYPESEAKGLGISYKVLKTKTIRQSVKAGDWILVSQVVLKVLRRSGSWIYTPWTMYRMDRVPRKYEWQLTFLYGNSRHRVSEHVLRRIARWYAYYGDLTLAVKFATDCLPTDRDRAILMNNDTFHKSLMDHYQDVLESRGIDPKVILAVRADMMVKVSKLVDKLLEDDNVSMNDLLSLLKFHRDNVSEMEERYVVAKHPGEIESEEIVFTRHIPYRPPVALPETRRSEEALEITPQSATPDERGMEIANAS